MTDLAWAGGLFVGEGSVFAQHRKGAKSYLTLALLMTDERTVERFRAIVEPYVERMRQRSPNKITRYQPKRPNSRLVYHYQLTGYPALSVARALHPHLTGTDKGDQLERVLEDLGLDLWAPMPKNSNAVLTDEQVREIVELYDSGWTQKALAERYGVHRNTIWREIRNVNKEILP